MPDLLRFTVNGQTVEIEAAPDARLLDVLREGLHLTGTKEGCGEGECGACAVLLDGRLVNSCLIPAWSVEGAEVVTIEGREQVPELTRIETALAEHGGVQCGFCTPGMVLAIHALLRESPRPTPAATREALSGNLCRCTGYAPILEAVEALTGVPQGSAPEDRP